MSLFENWKDSGQRAQQPSIDCLHNAKMAWNWSKVDLLIQWVIEISQTFYFTLAKATNSIFFSGNFIGVFNKNVGFGYSKTIQFKLLFLVILVSLYIPWLANDISWSRRDMAMWKENRVMGRGYIKY